MKSILFFVVLIAAAGLAVFLLMQPDNVEYVSAVTDDIAALEMELEEIEALSADGRITPEQADEARLRVITKLDAIDTSIRAAQNAKLSDTQKQQLGTALGRLQSVLLQYRGTLAVVDQNLSEETKRTLSVRGNTSARGFLIEAAAGVVEVVEDAQEALGEIVESIADEFMSEINDDATTSEEGIGSQDTDSDSDTILDSEIETETSVSGETEEGSVEATNSMEEEAEVNTN